jgi:hypothetical protein
VALSSFKDNSIIFQRNLNIAVLCTVETAFWKKLQCLCMFCMLSNMCSLHEHNLCKLFWLWKGSEFIFEWPWYLMKNQHVLRVDRTLTIHPRKLHWLNSSNLRTFDNIMPTYQKRMRCSVTFSWLLILQSFCAFHQDLYQCAFMLHIIHNGF